MWFGLSIFLLMQIQLGKNMSAVIDPWVVHYERLMDILSKAAVSKDIQPRIQRKILLWHKDQITKKELREALNLFSIVFKEDFS